MYICVLTTIIIIKDYYSNSRLGVIYLVNLNCISIRLISYAISLNTYVCIIFTCELLIEKKKFLRQI